MQPITFRIDETALAPIQNLVIGANFEEVKAALDTQLSAYRTLIVTEDGVSSAKADLARIRKIKSNLDEARIAVKRAYNAPVAAFEAKCKELTDICAVAIGNIDEQVKQFEGAEKAKKIAALREFFDENAKDYAGVLDFETIFNPRWENKTYAAEDAKKDILREIGMTAAAVGAITALHSEFETELLSTYRKTRDLAAVMRQNENLAEVKRFNERRKQEQEALAAARERERQESEMAATATTEPDITPFVAPFAPVEETPLHVLDFRVWVTDDQIAALRDFLRSNGIKYGRVPTA